MAKLNLFFHTIVFRPQKSFSYRDLLYKVLIFIGTVAVIVYFLPRDGKFNYQFDINKPWKYGQLMATFEFPIYKEDAIVKHEQDSILATFQPYYQLDKNIEKSVLGKLKADYQSHLHDIVPSTDYMRHIESKLQEDSTVSIMVIDDKLAYQRATEQLFSVKDAYAYLLTADTAHYSPHILRQCSLNEYLYPNLTYDEQRTETAKKEILDNYAWANGIVVSGQKIIDRGEIVTPETYNILASLRKECTTVLPHHVLLRGDSPHGDTQYLQCLYPSIRHAAHHHPRIPRLAHSIPYTCGHHTDLLHLPALPARIYPVATVGRTCCHFQPARIVATLAVVPYSGIGDTHLCGRLLLFRADYGK